MNKGKAPISYKTMVVKTPEQLQTEALKAVPKEMRLRDDAYALSVKSNVVNEAVYPYVPSATIWIAPIEAKYSHLNPMEATAFYLKNHADPFLFPKDHNYYQAILTATNSVEFNIITRTDHERAYSKAFIKKVITPEQWNGDFYRFIEPSNDRRDCRFNYFDYVKAWDGAFCYDNKQRRHSWFFQFRNFDVNNLPQWFIRWFFNWGFNPIILPDKIRKIYEDFETGNPSMKVKELGFAAIYQVPWIVRWDAVICSMPLKKFEKTYANIPYLGRRILIKWWDKFEFFEDSIFSVCGLVLLEPATSQPQKKSAAEIIKELLDSGSKTELKKQLQELLEDSEEEDLEDIDETMQDSQDPFAN